MRRLNGQQTRALMRQLGIGDYGMDDPNTGNYHLYSEAEIFRAVAGGSMQGGPGGASGPDPFFNPIAFNMVVFSTNNTSASNGTTNGNGSVQVLSQNFRRALFLIQNQSTSADLYVNFGSDAGVNQGLLLDPGLGVFFDVVCPNNYVTVYFDSATNQPGIVIEGAPVQ